MKFEIGETVKIKPTGRPGTIVAYKGMPFDYPWVIDDGIGSFPIQLAEDEIEKIEVD